MAHEPRAAVDLMEKLWSPALRRVEEERDALQRLVDAEGGNFTLAAHDWRYYAEKLRASRYALDQAELSAYFQLDAMIDAAFSCAERLFGLRFQRRHDLPVYHPDVRAYEVTDARDRHIAIFYGDYFSRAGKRSGAWMSGFRGQKKLGGEERPVVVNVMNFSKPTPDRPSLLTLTEVTTLFHEFGHALHGMLSDVVYPSMSGTSTPTDFVEFPSQVFEHWACRPEVLEKYARHFETGAPIPQSMIDRITASRHFNQGFGTVEFLASALVDFKLHWRADAPADIGAAEADILSGIAMPDTIVDAASFASFCACICRRRLCGRLLFLPLVGNAGRRRFRRLRGGRRHLRSRNRAQAARPCLRRRQPARSQCRLRRISWPRPRYDGAAAQKGFCMIEGHIALRKRAR